MADKGYVDWYLFAAILLLMLLTAWLVLALVDGMRIGQYEPANATLNNASIAVLGVVRVWWHD